MNMNHTTFGNGDSIYICWCLQPYQHWTLTNLISQSLWSQIMSFYKYPRIHLGNHSCASVCVSVCLCCVWKICTVISNPNHATSTCCLMQPYTALPAPISALRCTEAESRMEQSRVRWQWHPSHAMNNQWTPSGAYNRGAQLQSFSPGCLSQFTPLTVSQFFTCSLAFLTPLFPHIFTQSLSHCLFNLHPRPVLHPSPALTPHLQ